MKSRPENFPGAWWLSVCAVACGVACGSPSGGPRDGAPGADAFVETPGEVAADPTPRDFPDEAGAVQTTLACPTPGALPFTTQTHAFENPETAALIAANPFRLGVNQDFVGLIAEDQVIRGSFLRGETGLAPTAAISREWVSLWRLSPDQTWQELGRVRTGDDGSYAFTLTAADRFGPGTHRVYAVLEGDGSCAEHAVIVWPAGSQVVVTDIDGTLTLSDSEFAMQLGDVAYDPVEVPSASAMMNAWSGKGYLAVYLTARPHPYRELTRNWLDMHGFPFGLVVTSETLTFGDSTKVYKAAELAHETGDLHWTIVAAYGNADTDIAAYAEAGIPKEVTFIYGDEGGKDGTIAIPASGYADHIATFIASRPDAVQPF